MARKPRTVEEILAFPEDPFTQEDREDTIVVYAPQSGEHIYTLRTPSEDCPNREKLFEKLAQLGIKTKQLKRYERIPQGQFKEIPYSDQFNSYLLEDNPNESIIRKLKPYEEQYESEDHSPKTKHRVALI